MRKYVLYTAAMVLGCFHTLHTLAQDDSARLDAGTLSLKREFTQSISIKGADLERMPFSNLSDAIAAWLYGSYTQPGALSYVVDGNPVSDVNAYPIQDIEEVILVQNAAVLIGTAGVQQELVLIRTKHGKGPWGITAAGGGGLVNGGGNGVSTSNQVYQNYYLGAYRNLNKVSFGASANWLNDVLPSSSMAFKTITPDNVQRWRLNGYFTWQPDKRNQVDLRMNYTVQYLVNEVDSTDTVFGYRLRDKVYQNYVAPSLHWHGNWLPGLTNDLQAADLHSKYMEIDSTTGKVLFVGDLVPVDTIFKGGEGSYHLWIRDRLAYTLSFGEWLIEPAFNVSYEHFNEKTTNTNIQIESLYFSESSIFEGSKSNAIFVTPSIDIGYKKIIYLVGGIMKDVGKQYLPGRPRNFPFASLTLDLLRLANVSGTSSLKIFGSYAQRTTQSVVGYTLADPTHGLDLSLHYSDFYGVSFTGPVSPVTVTPGFIALPFTPPAYWVWETGASYSGWKDRLLIQYNFERRNILTAGYDIVAGSILFPTFAEWQSSLHHADIRIKILEGKGLSWQSGLNATLLRSRIDSIKTARVAENPTLGDIYPNPYSWTGGLVNRLQVKDFSAGLDLLYHFGERAGRPAPAGLNSVMIPNLYAGYQWHLGHVQTLAFFLESRGLIRSSRADLLDERRYYTIGGKWSL